MMDEKKTGNEKLASLNKAAAKHFQMAYDIIISMKECPLPEKETKFLRANLHYNAAYHKAEAMYRKALIHLKDVDENIRAGHMGFAVSYLRIAKTELDGLLGNTKKGSEYEQLSNEQQEELQKFAKIIYTNYDNCNLKNTKVYQQKEYTPEQLPEIPEEKSVITGAEPSKIAEKIGVETKFECFLSPEIIALKREFVDLCSMKVLEIENKLKNFHTVKGKSYSENFVNYLLNLLVQDANKKVEIPKDMKVKIERFRSQGGFNTLELTKKNIIDNGFNCGHAIEEIKNLLAKEKSEDDEVRKKYPAKWTRAYSEQSNQEYVYRLRGNCNIFY
jgi:hypothetical protein